MAVSIFRFPTPIYFGPGVRYQLPQFMASQGFRLPLIITDPQIAQLPVVQELIQKLSSAGLKIAVFSKISSRPSNSQVNEGVHCFKNHDADCIIGIGGGAALDVAKAVALMAAHRKDIFDYADNRDSAAETPNALPIDAPIPFWVSVPTTAGTGSEVAQISAIWDERKQVRIIDSPKLLARAVFADPELTLTVPPPLTAAMGMAALTHCIESYLAPMYHPICDGIALEGVRLVSQSLAACVRNPMDLESRQNLMMASIMGAIALQKGLGLTHACAHALSTIADLHYGLACGIMLTHTLKFSATAVSDSDWGSGWDPVSKRFAVLGTCVGLENSTAARFLGWVEEFKAQIHIPTHLRAAGVQLNSVELSQVSHLAFERGRGRGPKKCSEEDLRGIFTAAACGNHRKT